MSDISLVISAPFLTPFLGQEKCCGGSHLPWRDRLAPAFDRGRSGCRSSGDANCLPGESIGLKMSRIMATAHSLTRRRFLGSSLVGAAAVVMVARPVQVRPAVTKPQRDPFHGLKVGVASYSLHSFSFDQAIAMTRQLGVKYITLKEMHLPYTSTTEERKAARAKVEAAGLTLLSGGVIYMKNDEAQVRGFFDYARDAGMPTIVAAPDLDALDLVEKTAKEYDIRVAIHNHGPGDQRYPSPFDVLRLIKDRDPHMGVCIDLGHTVRLGEDPIDAIQQCAKRLYDFHFKDVTSADKNAKAIAVGRGIIDIVAVLKTLLELNYSYHLALEYETESNAPLPGMAESFAYVRGVLAAV